MAYNAGKSGLDITGKTAVLITKCSNIYLCHDGLQLRGQRRVCEQMTGRVGLARCVALCQCEAPAVPLGGGSTIVGVVDLFGCRRRTAKVWDPGNKAVGPEVAVRHRVLGAAPGAQVRIVSGGPAVKIGKRGSGSGAEEWGRGEGCSFCTQRWLLLVHGGPSMPIGCSYTSKCVLCKRHQTSWRLVPPPRLQKMLVKGRAAVPSKPVGYRARQREEEKQQATKTTTPPPMASNKQALKKVSVA